MRAGWRSSRRWRRVYSASREWRSWPSPDSLPPGGPSRGTDALWSDRRGGPAAIPPTARAERWHGDRSRRATSRHWGFRSCAAADFKNQDRDPDQDVAILSDTMARRMFPGEDPVGKQIRPGRIGPWLTVAGVAGNVKNSGLADRDDPEYYVVRKHSPAPGRTATAIIRGPIDARAMAGQARAVIAGLDAALPVTIETLAQRVGRMAARPRFNAVVLAIFAGMGLVLAAIGLYGVMSFLVAQRTGEIGVRMALGATPGAIRRLVLGMAARWTAAGALLGAAGWLFTGSLLQAMLFHVPARDPWALAGALAVLSGIGLAAAWVPARRAARVDPMEALRQE